MLKWVVLLIILIIIVIIIVALRQSIQKRKVGGAELAPLIENIRNLKDLSKGWEGETFNVSIGNTKYVLKREKLLPSSVMELPSGRLHINPDSTNALRFYNVVNNMLKPDQKYFTKLLDFRVIECPEYTFTVPEGMKKIAKNNKNIANHIKMIVKSKYCAEYLMEYGGEKLSDYLNIRIKNRIIGDKFIIKATRGLIKASMIMDDFGFYHGDLHDGNILCNDSGDIKIIDYNAVVDDSMILYHFNFNMWQILYILSGLSALYRSIEEPKHIKLLKHWINKYPDDWRKYGNIIANLERENGVNNYVSNLIISDPIKNFDTIAQELVITNTYFIALRIINPRGYLEDFHGINYDVNLLPYPMLKNMLNNIHRPNKIIL